MLTMINKLMTTRNILKFVVPFVFLTALSITLWASTNGKTGKTSSTSDGCSCHNTSSSSNTTLSVSSNAGTFKVSPGSETQFTVTVSNSGKSKAGVNIAVKTTETGSVNAGTLSPVTGSGLKSESSELTHSSPKNLSGGSAEFSFKWTAPNSPGTYYLRAIGNAVNGDNMATPEDEWNWMSVKEVIVKGIDITAPTGGEVWCAGASHDITWDATGVDNVKIELSDDGGSSYSKTIAASVDASTGSYSWNIPSSQTSGTQYRVKISDVSDPDLNDESESNFEIAAETEITSQPETRRKCEGDDVTFTVVATGSNLTYQWKKDGSSIPGETSNSLVIQDIAPDDAAEYTVVVDGACGNAVTSNAAELIVDQKPEMIEPPSSQDICKGQSVVFMVNADGTDLEYQWKKDGSNLSGETSNELIIDNVTQNDAGSYTVVISGKCPPSVESDPAVLTILDPPEITQQPADKEGCLEDQIELTVQAEGKHIMYQWRKDGQNINGATDPTYLIESLSHNDAGTYDVIADNGCDPKAFSDEVQVTVLEIPSITSHPSDTTVIEGRDAVFSVEVEGEVDEYQWRRNSIELIGMTERTLTISGVTKDDQGGYDCLVTNQCGEVVSQKGRLTVEEAGPGPMISLSESTLNYGEVDFGENKDMTVTVTNSGDENLNVTDVSLTGANHSLFIIRFGGDDFNLEPEAAHDITVRFNSEGPEGDKTAQIEFTSNANNSPTISLKAFAKDTAFVPKYDATTSVESLDFENVELTEDKTMDFDLENTGNDKLTVNNISIQQDDNVFSIVSPPTPFDLEEGDSQEIKVKFAPQDEKTYNGTVSIDIAEIDDPLEVSIAGAGIPSAVFENPQFVKSFNIFPNPSNGKLTMKFALDISAEYELTIIDVTGRTIKNFEGFVSAYREKSINWDGITESGVDISSGVYRAVFRANGKVTAFDIIINK